MVTLTFGNCLTIRLGIVRSINTIFIGWILFYTFVKHPEASLLFENGFPNFAVYKPKLNNSNLNSIIQTWMKLFKLEHDY